MRREFLLLLCALQFLTRLPVRVGAEFRPDWINRSARYFPLIGQFVGVISGAVLLLGAKYWGGWVPALLAVLAGTLITGALHEDGLADTADGFGGGRDPAHRLAIMKDSSTGAYGVLALIFCVVMKTACLSQISPWEGFFGLVAAHGVARAATVFAMHALPYAGDSATTKIVTENLPPARGEFAAACLLACWPLFFLGLSRAFFGIIICAVITLAMARLARKLIGGQRGDVLGAIEQLCEVGFLLACAAKFSP